MQFYINYNDVKMVHFEPTQMCQASCPMCDRNKNGGEVNQYLKDESADTGYNLVSAFEKPDCFIYSLLEIILF